jgi:hypothetical protein
LTDNFMILLPYLENGRLYTIGTCPKLLVNAIISSIPYTKTNANPNSGLLYR